MKSTGRFSSGQQVGDCYYRPRFQPVGTQALPKQRTARRDSVLEVGFPCNPVLHALNVTGLALSLPTRHLKIDPRRGSDVISNTGERRAARPAVFFFFQRHKVDFVLSVALETHLPLKEDQYTFMISVSSSVCGFRYVRECLHLESNYAAAFNFKGSQTP